MWQGDVPEAVRTDVPRYPLMSATLIGRLAGAKEGTSGTGVQGRSAGGCIAARVR
jgi:hypothetical protein